MAASGALHLLDMNNVMDLWVWTQPLVLALICPLLAYVGYRFVSYVKWSVGRGKWEKRQRKLYQLLIGRRQRHREESIFEAIKLLGGTVEENKKGLTHNDPGFLIQLDISLKEKDILENHSSVSGIHSLLRSGEASCVEIITAFSKQGIRECTHLKIDGKQGMNCITELTVKEALCTAKKIDETILANLKIDLKAGLSPSLVAQKYSNIFDVDYPLLGVPLTVKDVFLQKGVDATCGLAKFVYYFAREKIPKGWTQELVNVMKQEMQGWWFNKENIDVEKPSSLADAYTGCPIDGVLIHLLRTHGGIPLFRGNVPQLLLLPESANFIYGTSSNYLNPSRGVGGSSGGDAGIVQAGGAVLGLGSDVAGSLRIPAFFCGLTSFKPSQRRLSYLRMNLPSMKNFSGGVGVAVPAVPGPMGNSVACCEALMRSFCKATVEGEMRKKEEYKSEKYTTKDTTKEGNDKKGAAPSNKPGFMSSIDTSIADLGWDSSLASSLAFKTKLRIGYVQWDTFFELTKTQKRALEMTIKALEKEGEHELIEIDTSKIEHADGWTAYGSMVGLVGGEGNMYSLMDALEGEELLPTYAEMYRNLSLPNFLRPVIRVVLNLLGERRRMFLLSHGRDGGHSARDWLNIYTSNQAKAKEAWSTQVFSKHSLDCVIYPGLPPAFPHKTAKQLFVACSNVFIFNTLGLPVGALPVTTVREDECNYLAEKYKDSISKELHSTMLGAKGLPVGIQVVTQEWQDEKCFGCMYEVERCLKEMK